MDLRGIPHLGMHLRFRNPRRSQVAPVEVSLGGFRCRASPAHTRNHQDRRHGSPSKVPCHDMEWPVRPWAGRVRRRRHRRSATRLPAPGRGRPGPSDWSVARPLRLSTGAGSGAQIPSGAPGVGGAPGRDLNEGRGPSAGRAMNRRDTGVSRCGGGCFWV